MATAIWCWSCPFAPIASPPHCRKCQCDYRRRKSHTHTQFCSFSTDGPTRTHGTDVPGPGDIWRGIWGAKPRCWIDGHRSVGRHSAHPIYTSSRIYSTCPVAQGAWGVVNEQQQHKCLREDLAGDWDVMGFEAGENPGILSAFLLWLAKAKQVGFALVSVLGKCGLWLVWFHLPSSPSGTTMGNKWGIFYGL